MAKIEALSDYVVIKQQAREQETSGGLLLDSVTAKIVVAIGPDVTTVGVGDEVVCPTDFHRQFSIEGLHHLIVKESEVMARIGN